MKERERIAASAILTLLLLGWLGFLVHRSPRFAGSGVGAIFGIAAAVLMFVPLLYPLVTRIAFLRARVTTKSWLAVHVLTGIVAPMLALVHTGHKFDSTAGIALTAVMLLVVVSGFAARYLLSYVNVEITAKLALLETARGDLDSAWGVLERSPAEVSALPKARLLTAGLASVGIELPTPGPAGDVTRIAESVADLEYAIRTHEVFKRWFRRSLKLHAVLSLMLYALLVLHVGSEIYFGLRWLR